MVNITDPELNETKAETLPPASLETLKELRNESCSMSSQKDFKLQPSQRFLRRVLSPESPVRNLLMVHGTGAGKSCTAIQIAEEYIIRPEFQDKQVLVLANPAVQQNFKSQLFDVAKVYQDPDGLLFSKQCTGRRYLEMIQRAQAEPLQVTNKESQQRIETIASKIINEFYEFQGYNEFANIINGPNGKKNTLAPSEYTQWIHDTFDNRLFIVDEAHNLRETTETETSKLVAVAIEEIVKTANGMTLVLLTATPMYDKFDEIMYYFNLFLWNDRRIPLKKAIPTSEIFEESGDFKEGKESLFRGWCQDYVSFVKGENPFTFPFRLPPPDKLIAAVDRETDIFGQKITDPRKYLILTKSFVSPQQAEAIKGITPRAMSDPKLVCVTPENKSFREVFDKSDGQYTYKTEKFLSPSKIALYSSKFGLITRTISEGTGLVFIYSNIVELGAQLFAMCLEEHGYEPAFGERLLKETANEVPRGSKGKYALFTSETPDADIRRTLTRIKSRENAEGSDIKVLIASPKVSEGVDFRFIRQIHVLDPWFNMSRIEQVLGRGMRTCSHALLPFEQQNCTVYLHVCRYPDSKQETLDEYIYRVFVEGKAIKISKVKRVIMESAMDCVLQSPINSLPKDWREELKVPQIRSQDQQQLNLTLLQMFAPTFEDVNEGLTCKVVAHVKDELHVRPLSAILDVRDEIFDKLLVLFSKKPIWSKEDLISHRLFKSYDQKVVLYNIQDAIRSGFELKDKNGTVGKLESRDGMFAFSTGKNQSMLDRILKVEKAPNVDLREHEKVPQEEKKINLDAKIDSLPEYIRLRFRKEILEWYAIDHLLTEDQRIQFILESDFSEIYSRSLVAETKSGKKLYILGSKKIYNEDKELITPIGEEKDGYTTWVDALKDKFIETKNQYSAYIHDDKITFNLDEKTVPIKRADRKKVIRGRSCISYLEPVLNAFAKWLHDEEIPPSANTKKDRCLYLNFLVREAILANKPGILWWTMQEWEILDEIDNRKELLTRIKD